MAKYMDKINYKHYYTTTAEHISHSCRGEMKPHSIERGTEKSDISTKHVMSATSLMSNQPVPIELGTKLVPNDYHFITNSVGTKLSCAGLVHTSSYLYFISVTVGIKTEFCRFMPFS